MRIYSGGGGGLDIQTLSDELIRYGKEQQMQDLYIYASTEKTSLLFRRHAVKEEYRQVPLATAQQLISRFKYLGQMDVGEKRKAQLGAITYSLKEEVQRLRISTVGDYRGQESMVIRFLYDLTSVEHFFPEDAKFIQNKIQQKVGLYLFSGPTGSGKTTFMYHLARHYHGQVIAIEDPVEIEEAAFLQLQTNEKIGQTYNQLIKLSLRHRPDLLIIGEIRDGQTAHAAIRAALTGHTVLATLHARGVIETYTRFTELANSEVDLKHCLNGIIYQELLMDSSQAMKTLFAYKFYTGQQEEVIWQERYQKIQQQVNKNETETS